MVIILNVCAIHYSMSCTSTTDDINCSATDCQFTINFFRISLVLLPGLDKSTPIVKSYWGPTSRQLVWRSWSRWPYTRRPPTSASTAGPRTNAGHSAATASTWASSSAKPWRRSRTDRCSLITRWMSLVQPGGRPLWGASSMLSPGVDQEELPDQSSYIPTIRWDMSETCWHGYISLLPPKRNIFSPCWRSALQFVSWFLH